MSFKVGDLVKTKNVFFFSYSLENADRGYLRGRRFEPEELNNALVEVVEPRWHGIDIVLVYYPGLKGFCGFRPNNLLPLE